MTKISNPYRVVRLTIAAVFYYNPMPMALLEQLLKRLHFKIRYGFDYSNTRRTQEIQEPGTGSIVFNH